VIGKLKKVSVWIVSLLLGVLLIFVATVVWLFSLIERATDPVSKFILENNAYTLREVPENIVPLGISRDDFLKFKGVRKFKPVVDHNTIDGRQGFHRILRNRLGQCDMDLRIYATFNDNSELTSLHGFTPTYMCTIEP